MKIKYLIAATLLLFITSCSKLSVIEYSITESTTLQEDQTTLSNFFNDIQEISESKSCTNAENWRFIAYGSKACGGSQGYITYSIQINTKDFINKVESYTELEAKYNEKWQIISDCAIIPSPNSISCIDGEANLFF